MVHRDAADFSDDALGSRIDEVDGIAARVGLNDPHILRYALHRSERQYGRQGNLYDRTDHHS
jgi:hypothetical protein